MKLTTFGLLSVLTVLFCFGAGEARAQLRMKDEPRVLTENELRSEYFGWVFSRLGEQHAGVDWSPADILDAATVLTLVEYTDGTVFAVFSGETRRFWDDTQGRPQYVMVFGPAVVFSVSPDEGRRNIAGIRHVTKDTTDLDGPGRFIVHDDKVIVTFMTDTGGHGPMTRIMQYRMDDEARRGVKALMTE